MREHLLGYLLGALEPTEHELVAARLNADAEFQAELERLREKLEPLAADAAPYEPPAGLAVRTCGYVAVRAAEGAIATGAPVVTPASAWRLQDLLVAGGIVVAGCMLLFPAIAASRFDARRSACQNNLRTVGIALDSYSDAYGVYPVVPSQGPLAVAGMYAPTLYGLGYLESPSWLVCPASPTADGGEFKVPTLVELQTAGPQQLAALQRRMGGDYGYSFGYYQDGVYQGHKHRGRKQFALMADAPQEEQPGCRSTNHGGRGQNVLFDDFHVGFLTNCCLADHGDHIYHNAHGYIGAGVHVDDSVIAQSGARILWFKVELGK
ncbi:MAG TPA: DUF1559 domain-containing protein [Pirellulales bacterium]|nr:DUF1559 domain-containing protein [Pirellulales bacterium]